jgi:PqqD family protein of HPr-rel-A system
MADELISPTDIDGTFRPRRAPSVAFTELDGEIVLYDEDTGHTHLLNPTAGVLWQCFDGDATLDELAADVADAYGIDPDAAATDVQAATRSMGELGVIDGVRGTALPPPPAPDEDQGGGDCG